MAWIFGSLPQLGMLNTIDLVLRPERRLDFAFPVFGAGRG